MGESSHEGDALRGGASTTAVCLLKLVRLAGSSPCLLRSIQVRLASD